MTNCVNCGAPLEGLKCEYCGTIHENTDVEVLYSDNEIIDVVLKNPYITPNEIRTAAGLPPIN